MNTQELIFNNPKLRDLMDLIRDGRIKPISETAYLYIFKFSEVCPILQLCQLFGVGRTSYYDCQKQRHKPDPDLAVRDQILKIRQEEHQPTLGYRKITAILKRKQIQINHKKIYRIMKKYGLLSTSLHSKKMSVLYKGVKPYRNLVNQNFNTFEQPDQCWCIDITKLDSDQGSRQYLCAIIDLFDRSIVSYKIYAAQTVRLVRETIESALRKVKPEIPPSIILHSDQGNVFKSSVLKRFLNNTPITQSMSKKATPVDNAVIESFFANLKKECIYISDLETNEDVVLAVIDYIYYYNHLRPHSFNKCSPLEKRCQAS